MKRIGKMSCDESNDDMESRLHFNKNSRFIFISGVINWQLADEFFDALIGFESFKSKKPITIYINSEGGDAYAMFKIYDHIRNSLLPIITVVSGHASSAGFIIFLAGDLRKAFPNAVFGFHAPTIHHCAESNAGPEETTETAFHQNSMLDAIVRIVKNNSNMSEKTIREYFRILTRIDVETALKFGLAHQVINPPKKVLPKPWRKILKEQK